MYMYIVEDSLLNNIGFAILPCLLYRSNLPNRGGLGIYFTMYGVIRDL